MRCVRFLVPGALAVLVVACGGTSSNNASADEDERGSLGVPNPAADYCTKLGYSWTSDGNCGFPDGTTCDEWSFYRGECGQAHSYCNTHGGSISSTTEDLGGGTSVYAVCDVNGKKCKESDFFATAKCE
jgi:putative hemolysin